MIRNTNIYHTMSETSYSVDLVAQVVPLFFGAVHLPCLLHGLMDLRPRSFPYFGAQAVPRSFPYFSARRREFLCRDDSLSSLPVLIVQFLLAPAAPKAPQALSSY